jgi:hypothetical protein
MLRDIFFVLKMFVVTVLVVLVMQIHIGEKSVEDHFHSWVKHSAFIDYVEEAVDGGMALFRGIYKKADTGIHTLLAKTIRSKHEKKERGLAGMTLKRHATKQKDDGSLESDLSDLGEAMPSPKSVTSSVKAAASATTAAATSR